MLAVVDGAGGTARGALAAERVCAALAQCARLPEDWCDWLRDRDMELARLGGQAAAVVVDVRGGWLRGASVGDCEAHVFYDGLDEDLTRGQTRKPLLGDGRAQPVAFGFRARGIVVVASDGLWKYARRDEVVRVVSAADRVAERLVDCARLPSGPLQDDIGVIACAVGP